MKMHPLLDRALLRVLRLDPVALVVLSRPANQPAWSHAHRARLRILATRPQPPNTRGVTNNTSTADGDEREDDGGVQQLLRRVVWVAQRPHHEYHASVCAAHVALDPFPFGGGVTLSDALRCPVTLTHGTADVVASRYHAVPVVTAPQLQTVHRLGQGILTAANDVTAPIHQHTNAEPYHAVVTVTTTKNTSSKGHGNATTAGGVDVAAVIDAYAAAAVRLAHRTQCLREASTMAPQVNQDGTTQQQEELEEKATGAEEAAAAAAARVLYDEDEATVREWERFLLRV